MNISPELFVELLKLKKSEILTKEMENVDWGYLFVLRESNIATTI